MDEPRQRSPSQRMDLRVTDVEVVSDESDAQTPVGGGVRLTVRWPVDGIRRRARGARRSADAASAFARWFDCCRRRSITIRASGAARIILLDQGITSTATVAADRVERLGQDAGRVSGVPRERMAARVNGAAAGAARGDAGLPAPLRLSEDDAVMLAAMVAGDRTYLTHCAARGL